MISVKSSHAWTSRAEVLSRLKISLSCTISRRQLPRFPVWDSINSSWILAASTPVVSSCRSSTPPPSVNAVNDGSLSTNISEDAQQSTGTYKNFHFIFGAHMCICLFASVENSAMSVTKRAFEERAAIAFKKKVAKLFDNADDQLFSKLNISGIFLLLFSPNASEND